MEKVAVIMSTYNGGHYLREQIDSILKQKNVDPILFVRDDGSKDHTVEILEDYSNTYDNVIFQNRYGIKNLGVKESFLTLLQWVLENYPEIDILSFADQDDYWEEQKLVEGIKFYKKEKTKWLYFSNKTIVDENLKFLYNEHLVYYFDVLEIFWGSQASGCTMLFNRMLADEMIRYRDRPHSISLLHDSLLYRTAHIVGAEICFDENSYIKYRQHGNNVIGIANSKKTNNDWKGLLRKSPHFISGLSYQLRENYNAVLNSEGRYYLDLVCTYRTSLRSKLKLIFDKKAMKRGLKLYLIWIAKLILGRL